MNNDLAQFSEEELTEIINDCTGEIYNTPTNDETTVSPRVLLSLARIAMAAKQGRPTFEDWLSSRTDTIEVDCGCVTTEAFYHWLKVAYEATPQPAHTEQDGWKLVPIELTIEMREAFHNSYEDFENCIGECPDSQWKAMIAAAPKPESE